LCEIWPGKRQSRICGLHSWTYINSRQRNRRRFLPLLWGQRLSLKLVAAVTFRRRGPIRFFTTMANPPGISPLSQRARLRRQWRDRTKKAPSRQLGDSDHSPSHRTETRLAFNMAGAPRRSLLDFSQEKFRPEHDVWHGRRTDEDLSAQRLARPPPVERAGWSFVPTPSTSRPGRSQRIGTSKLPSPPKIQKLPRHDRSDKGGPRRDRATRRGAARRHVVVLGREFFWPTPWATSAAAICISLVWQGRPLSLFARILSQASPFAFDPMARRRRHKPGTHPRPAPRIRLPRRRKSRSTSTISRRRVLIFWGWTHRPHLSLTAGPRLRRRMCGEGVCV